MFTHKWEKVINPKTFKDVDPLLFKNYRIGTLLSYALGTWLFVILKVAFFISDIYTCIQLLAYNSWSNNLIKPYIPFHISKWIFAACILASFVLVLYNIVMAIFVYRSQNIARCYVNNTCRNTISIISYSKFCILNEISSHGTFQWFAFYVFFELKDCFGLIFADSPRQVINGLTLWSVLVTVGSGNNNDMYLGNLETLEGLINKIKAIALENRQEAVILSFSFFSFVLWCFFMAKFCFALLCSIFVYFKLIRDRKYSGLRDFVFIKINDHVDQLIIKRNMSYRSETLNVGLLQPSESVLELEDLEGDFNRLNTGYKIFNDSVNSFNNIQKQTDPSFDASDEYINQDNHIRPTSTIFENEKFYHSHHLKNELEKYGHSSTEASRSDINLIQPINNDNYAMDETNIDGRAAHRTFEKTLSRIDDDNEASIFNYYLQSAIEEKTNLSSLEFSNPHRDDIYHSTNIPELQRTTDHMNKDYDKFVSYNNTNDSNYYENEETAPKNHDVPHARNTTDNQIFTPQRAYFPHGTVPESPNITNTDDKSNYISSFKY